MVPILRKCLAFGIALAFSATACVPMASAAYQPTPSEKKASALLDSYVAKLRASNDDPAVLMAKLETFKSKLEQFRGAKKKARKYSGTTARLVDALINGSIVRIAGLRSEAGLPSPAPTGTPSSSSGSPTLPGSSGDPVSQPKPAAQYVGIRNATSDVDAIQYGLRTRTANVSKKFRIYDVSVYSPTKLSTPVSTELIPEKSSPSPSFVTKYLGLPAKLYFRSAGSQQAVTKLMAELERRAMKPESYLIDSSYVGEFRFKSAARKSYRLYVAEDGSEAFVVDYLLEQQ